MCTYTYYYDLVKPFANDAASPHERLNEPLQGNVRIALLPEGFAEGTAKGMLERFAEGIAKGIQERFAEGVANMYKYNTNK